MHVEPNMKHLHELVIPKIYAHWKEVAVCLCYSQETIEIMDKNSTSEYPMQCCEDMLRDWLCSDDSVNPHSWETLINTLKQIQQLTTLAEQIEENVEELIR